jgi:hypothetical protein
MVLLTIEGKSVATQRYSKTDSTWINHPTDVTQLIVAGENTMQLFDWTSLNRIESRATTAVTAVMPLISTTGLGTVLNRTWLTRPGHNLFTCLSWSKTQDIEIAQLDLATPGLNATVLTRKLLSHIKVPIGLVKSLLYFLDAQGWICSISLKAITDIKYYTRHFFIPLTWQTGAELSLSIISKSSVAFAHHDQLVVFHGFLEFEEKVLFEEVSGQT